MSTKTKTKETAKKAVKKAATKKAATKNEQKAVKTKTGKSLSIDPQKLFDDFIMITGQFEGYTPNGKNRGIVYNKIRPINDKDSGKDVKNCILLVAYVLQNEAIPVKKGNKIVGLAFRMLDVHATISKFASDCSAKSDLLLREAIYRISKPPQQKNRAEFDTFAMGGIYLARGNRINPTTGFMYYRGVDYATGKKFDFPKVDKKMIVTVCKYWVDRLK